MESLDKEFVVRQVKTHKDVIRDATDRLSDVLYKARVSKDLELSEEDSLTVRKILHEITSELSMIGGYCDGWTKRYIDKTVAIVGDTTSTKLRYLDALLLDLWATRVNGIIVDFTKTPFRLSKLKPIFDMLKTALEKIGQSRTEP